MAEINKVYEVNEPVAPTLGWSLLNVTVTIVEGLEYQGRLTLIKRPEGSREHYNWFAKYRGFDAWAIRGEGAKVGSGNSRVPDVEKFPFVLDPSINAGIKTVLSKWLNRHKSAKSLSESDVAADTKSPSPKPAPAAVAKPAVKATAPPVKAKAPPAPPIKPAEPVNSVPRVSSKPTGDGIILIHHDDPVPQVASSAPPVAVSPPPAAALAPPVAEVDEKASLGNEVWASPHEIVAFQSQQDDPSFSGQPRKWFDPVELEKLGTSMAEYEQQDAITVIPYVGPQQGIKWELVNGERRWRSALAKNLPKVKISVGKRVDKKTQHLRALIQNFCKAGHTARELSDALQEQIHAGMTIAGLASAVGLKPFYIVKMISLQRLHPELKVLLDPPVPKKDRLRVNEGQILSRIPMEDQVRIWNEAKIEPSRRLVVAKLNQLCKPLIKHPRVRKIKPSDTQRTIKRQFERLKMALIELSSVDGPTWKAGLQTMELEERVALLAEFNHLEGDLQLIKQRVVKEKTLLGKAAAVPDAAPAVEPATA